jgi:hypothetical protein
MWKGPSTVAGVAFSEKRLFNSTTSMLRPSTSEPRMNSWRLSSLMRPVASSQSIAAVHSSTLRFTSRAKACRCRTSELISSAVRGECAVPQRCAASSVMSRLRPCPGSPSRSAAFGKGDMRRSSVHLFVLRGCCCAIQRRRHSARFTQSPRLTDASAPPPSGSLDREPGSPACAAVWQTLCIRPACRMCGSRMVVRRDAGGSGAGHARRGRGG